MSGAGFPFESSGNGFDSCLEMLPRGISRLGVLVNKRDDRHATAGCLLSVLLFLPLFSHIYHPLLLFGGALIYAGLVVPIVLAYIPVIVVFHAAVHIYHAAVAVLHATVSFLLATCHCTVGAVDFVIRVFCKMWQLVLQAEEVILQYEVLHTMTNQVVFFMLAERILCPDQHFCSLYSLLFYNIVAYLKRSLTVRRWATYLQVTDVHSYLRMTTTFVALKLGKAVVMTMILMMVTLHFSHYEPSLSYLATTITYFLMTESAFNDVFCGCLTWLTIDALEQLEEFWTPVILRLISISASVIFIVFNLTHYWVCLIAAFTNVYIQYRELVCRSFANLHAAQSTISKYHAAGRLELEATDSDNLCPICLEIMTFARVTPCHHVFHGHCLRLCLRESNLCPLCKRVL